MSTRAGRVIFLEDVISEAIRRAGAVVQDRDLSPEEKARISRIVGIGAIKYADLSQSRIKEVVFDWDRMLAFEGKRQAAPVVAALIIVPQFIVASRLKNMVASPCYSSGLALYRSARCCLF